MATPYRKLLVIQGEGPTICLDCVFARFEHSGPWDHPLNFEDTWAEFAIAHTRTWRCVGTPDKEVDFLTGGIDMEKLPKCSEQNDGDCPWFSKYTEDKEVVALVTVGKKPWWRFW